MIAFMCVWAGTVKNLPSWFKHGEKAQVTWEQIQELFATGNNVMLKHHIEYGVESIVIGVDDKGFGQR